MGTTAQKGAYLNQTKQKLKQAINNIGGEVTDETTFREYVNQLQNVYDNLPKTEYQEGTEITLSNTLKGKLDFEDDIVGYGQTEQDTTTGYQLIHQASFGTFTDNGITFTQLADGGIKVNGTASADADVNLLTGNKSVANNDNNILIEANQNYVLSGNPNGDVNTISLVMHTKSYGNVVRGIGNPNVFSFTADVDMSAVRIIVKSGVTINNMILYPMLEKGSTAHTFEQYTGGQASPNPSYPQEIKYVRGKNRFNKATVTQRSYIDAQGVLKGADGTYCASDYIEVYQGSIVWSATTGNGYSLSIYDSSKTFIRSVGRTGNNAMVIPIANGEKYIRFTLLTADLDITQIEEGTQATPYLPYNTIEEVVSGINELSYAEAQTEMVGTLECKSNGDGTYTMDGTSSINGGVDFALPTAYTIKNGDYLFLYNEKTNVNVAVALKSSTEDQIVAPSLGTANKSFDLSSYAGRVVRYIRLYSNSGQTLNNVIVKPFIYNSSTQVPFEPYITPTSYQLSLGDYKFYGIGTYRDYILRTTGKNLFDIADVTNDSNNGVAISKSGFDITLNGTASANTTFEYTLSNPIVLKSGDKITVSKSSTAPSGTGGNITFRDSSNTSVFNTLHTSPSATYTATSDVTLTKIVFYVTSGTNINLTFRLQVERGSTASDYEPYGVGNWYKVGKIGEVQFANVNNIYQEVIFGVNKKYFFQTISTAKSLGNPSYNFLCEILSKSNGVANDYSGFFNGTNIVVLLNDSDTKETATSKYTGKALYYVLATPTYTPITGTLAEQLEAWWNGQTLNGTTIITSNGNLPMIIKVRGLKGE